MAIRVSIVEDDTRIRKGLVALIDGSEGFSCASVHFSAEDALREIPHVFPHVVLMDINLPNMDGVECVAQLKVKLPDIQVIMLTVFEDADMIFSALAAGASGYLLKRTPSDQILSAIKDVHNGGSPMTSQIARKVVQSFKKPFSKKPDTPSLTPREEEILKALSGGSRDKEIAETLFISIDTVHSHLRKIYDKLHVRSRTEAVLKYLNK
jgi:DNA-binding NarL/FixJ family response regulator